MEDRSGKMVGDNKQVAGKGNRTGKSKSWTLLLIGDLGKIGSFEVSRFLLVGFVGTIAFLLVYAGFMTLGYYRMHSRTSGLEERLEKAEAHLLAAKEDRDAAQVRLMLLGEADQAAGEKTAKVKKTKSSAVQKKSEAVASKAPEPREEKKSEEKPEAVKEIAAETAETPPVAEAKAPSQETPSEEVSSEATASSNVRVEDFQIWPANNDTAVRFKFKLENVSPRDVTLKGYTFVALEPVAGSDEPVGIAPWSPVEDGKPSLIKRGQYFGISRFKYVRGTLPDIRDLKRFEKATVYVYSDEGDLLYEKVCQIDAALRS